MNLNDLYDDTNSEEPFREFPNVGSPSTGRTVGDGIATSAKVGGAVAIVTLITQALPALLGGSALTMWLFSRGCNTPSVPSTPPVVMVPPVSQSPPPRIRQRRSEPIERRPRELDSRQATAELARSIQRSLPTEADTPAVTANPPVAEAPPETPVEPNLPHITAHPFGYRDPAGYSPNSPMNVNPLLGMLTNPQARRSNRNEISPLFEMWPGREFAGTSRMQGSPSERVLLKINEVRDGGSYIAAQLSLINKPRVKRAFTGFIENDQLTLQPVQDPQEFGMWLTYMPWHSKFPTDITLSMSADGKHLSGTSSANESFNFLPRVDPATTRARSGPVESEWLGIAPDSLSENSATTQWKIAAKDGEPLGGKVDHIWLFRKTSDNGGSFTWFAGDKTKASGRYSEDRESGHLDLTIDGKKFLALVEAATDETQAVKLCVADPGHDRPTRMDASLGKLFEIKPLN